MKKPETNREKSAHVSPFWIHRRSAEEDAKDRSSKRVQALAVTVVSIGFLVGFYLLAAYFYHRQ